MKKRKLHDNDFTDNNKGHADVDNEGSNGAAQNNNPISGNTCLLYVRNLPFDANERSIGEFFLPGIMTRLNRNTNAKRTGRLSGSSFVEMSTAAAASKAVAKSGQWLQGRRITVEFAAAASCGGGHGKNVHLDEIAATGVDALAAKVDEMVRKTDLNKVIADFERRMAAMEAAAKMTAMEAAAKMTAMEAAAKMTANMATRMAELEARVDGIVTSLSPAVIYSTMELCIYLFVYDGQKFTSNKKKTKKKNHSLTPGEVSQWAASLAGKILSHLLGKKKITWMGCPSEHGLFKKLVLQGIHLFLTVADTKCISDWPEDRNPVMHDGQFLSYLYPGMVQFRNLLLPDPAAVAIQDADQRIIKDDGSALSGKILSAFELRDKLPQSIGKLLSEIQTILHNKHNIVVNATVVQELERKLTLSASGDNG
jgi:hypothetical protein